MTHIHSKLPIYFYTMIHLVALRHVLFNEYTIIYWLHNCEYVGHKHQHNFKNISWLVSTYIVGLYVDYFWSNLGCFLFSLHGPRYVSLSAAPKHYSNVKKPSATQVFSRRKTYFRFCLTRWVSSKRIEHCGWSRSGAAHHAMNVAIWYMYICGVLYVGLIDSHM